jgi:hypothetical protein
MKTLVVGGITGVIVGVLYTVSPVTFWAIGLAACMLTLAATGLTPEQRRALILIVVLALLVRAVAIATMLVVGIPYHNDLATGALTGDEAYNLSRALRTRDVLLDQPVTRYDYFVAYDEYGYSTYLSFLTWLQVIAGPTPYSMRLLNAVLFVGGALLLFRVARSAFGSVVALGGLALLLMIPSLAASSISLLKEPVYFACSALLLWCVVAVARGEGGTRRWLPIVLGVAAFLLLDDLRRGALLLTASGLALAVAVRLALLRWWTAAAALVGVVAVAIVMLTAQPLQQRVLGGLESAARLQTGHVFTVGHAYKLLDEGFYVNPQATAASTLTLTPEQAARFVARGIISFVAEPLPWNLASRRELAFVPELVLWYGMLALAPIGLYAGWRSSPFVTSLLVCYPLPTALAVALTTGNVGTLLRLRGLVTPYLVWLSVMGLFTLVARQLRRAEA